MKEYSLEDRLFTVKANPDDKSHLTPDEEFCKKCKKKTCLYVCPAGVYKEEDGKIKVEYENCLECGACKEACPSKSLGWKYPEAKKGITFKKG